MRDAVGSEIAALRDEVAALRRAAEAARPEPATREDLDRLGGRLEDRMDSLPSPAPGGAEDAVRAAAAADRAEAAVVRLGDRVAAMFAGLEARLASMSSEDGVSARIETALNKVVTTTRYDYRLIRSETESLGKAIAGLRFRWRAFLAPWIAFVFVLGMVLESRAHLLYRWLWVE